MSSTNFKEERLICYLPAHVLLTDHNQSSMESLWLCYCTLERTEETK